MITSFALFSVTIKRNCNLLHKSTYRDNGRVVTQYHQDVYEEFLQLKVFVVRHQLEVFHQEVIVLH